MSFPTRIYLTGFMGSGKSTIGPIVANVLDYRFVDLDEEIEHTIGTSIDTYFATRGEAAFRQIESETLRETERFENIVVALGGGALTVPENLRFAKTHGTVVYLKVSSEQLFRRLRRSPTERPLLKNGGSETLDDAELLLRIQTLLRSRESFYRQADVIVDVGIRRVGTTVDAVVRALREHDKAG